MSSREPKGLSRCGRLRGCVNCPLVADGNPDDYPTSFPQVAYNIRIIIGATLRQVSRVDPNCLSYFGSSRRTAQTEYRKQIRHAFGQVADSPWKALRSGGFLLGGELLWEKVRKIIDSADSAEEIRWSRRADADEIARQIMALTKAEEDRRITIWARVRLGGERMTVVAGDYGYADGSGVHQLLKRLDEQAKGDPPLAQKMQALAKVASSVKS